MPVQVEKPIAARFVRQDEIVKFPTVKQGIVTRVVKAVTVGSKWATIHFTDNSAPLKVGINEPVSVVRTEETPEERDTRQREFANVSLARSIQSAPGNVEEARDKFTENLGFRADYHVHYYETFIAAQTEAGIWATVLRVSKSEDVADLHDAAVLVRGDVIEQLVDDRRGSRSTNQMSNAASGIELDAKAAWARNLKWILL